MNKRQGEYSPDRRRDDIKKHRQSSSNRDYELDDYETNSSDDSEEFDDTVGHIEFRKDDIYNERCEHYNALILSPLSSLIIDN